MATTDHSIQYPTTNPIMPSQPFVGKKSKGERRCFLIDSLLEERQKQLAIAAAREGGENGNGNGEEVKVKTESKIREEMLPNPCTTADQENDQQREENDWEKVEQKTSKDRDDDGGMKMEREDEEEEEEGGGGEGGREQQEEESRKRTLLEALAKLVPVLEGTNNNREAKREWTREAIRPTVAGQHRQQQQQMAMSADFLQRLRFFQSQQGAAAATSSQTQSSSQQSPFNQANNFLRFPPFFPSPMFPSQMINANNTPNSCWPPPSMVPSAAVTTMPKRPDTVAAKSPILGTTWPMSPSSFISARNGPTVAMLASFGVFRAAAAAAMASASIHNDGPAAESRNGNENNIMESIGSRSNGGQTSIASKRERNATKSRKGNSNKYSQHQQQRGSASDTRRCAGITGGTTSRSSNVKKYRCDICEKTFSRSNTLITHKRIHTGEKPFRCEHCGRAFRQPGNLTRHAYTHTTVKPFVCGECGKAFNRASNLQTHVRVHSIAGGGQQTTPEGAAGPGHECKQCQRQFGTRTELRAHKC